MAAGPLPGPKRRGWYDETVQRLFDELEGELGPLTADNAWQFITMIVMWAEPHEVGGKHESFLHLNDKMTTRAGQAQARAAEDWLRAVLPTSSLARPDFLGNFGRIYAEWEGWKGRALAAKSRNNVTGTAFEVAVQTAIERLCGVRPLRQQPLDVLEGFQLAPKRYHSKPDLVLFTPSDFRVLISTKWTMRKERLGTFLHEAHFYRQRRPDLQILFVVNDYAMNVMHYLVSDPLVDRAYHLNFPLFLDLHDPFGGEDTISADAIRDPSNEAFGKWFAVRERAYDFSALLGDIKGMIRAEPAPEPEEVVAEDEAE